MKIIQQAQIQNKKILMRVDFNVPIKNGKAQDVFRIKAVLPTVEYLIENGANNIILISHLGRPAFAKASAGKPEGKPNKDLSLESVAKELSKLLNQKNKVKKTKLADFDAFQITPKISLLENIRFYPEEEANNLQFAQKLANLGEIFVFDAFGVAHRNSASCIGLAKILPSFTGLLVQKETEKLYHLIHNPEKPFVLILGGIKIADKLPVIKNLYGKVDAVVVGGGIANTFLTAKEIPIGKSAAEANLKDEAVQIMNMMLDDPKKDIFIPQDVVVSKSVEKPSQKREISRSEIQNDDYIVDIGPKTIKMVEPIIKEAKTIFWNGALGVCEIPEFGAGSQKIAKIISKSEAEKVLAGGDTVAAVEKFGLIDKFDFVSTGGGAALEYLSGKNLPALEALE